MTTGNRELDSLLQGVPKERRWLRTKNYEKNRILKVTDLMESATAELQQAMELLRAIGDEVSSQK